MCEKQGVDLPALLLVFHIFKGNLIWCGENKHNATVFPCFLECAGEGLDCLPLTVKLTSRYKADYVELRGTLLDPFSSGTASDSVYIVLIIRKI